MIECFVGFFPPHNDQKNPHADRYRFDGRRDFEPTLPMATREDTNRRTMRSAFLVLWGGFVLRLAVMSSRPQSASKSND